MLEATGARLALTSLEDSPTGYEPRDDAEAVEAPCTEARPPHVSEVPGARLALTSWEDAEAVEAVEATGARFADASLEDKGGEVAGLALGADAVGGEGPFYPGSGPVRGGEGVAGEESPPCVQREVEWAEFGDTSGEVEVGGGVEAGGAGPHTPHSTPYTLRPQPSTLNPRPSTLQPSTLKPLPRNLLTGWERSKPGRGGGLGRLGGSGHPHTSSLENRASFLSRKRASLFG